MGEAEGRDLLSRPLERRIDDNGCTNLVSVKSACQKVPVCLSNGELATITCRDAYCQDEGTIVNMCSNEDTIANRGMLKDCVIITNNESAELFSKSCGTGNVAENQQSPIKGNHQIESETSLMQTSLVIPNNTVTSEEELNISRESTESYRSFKIKRKRGRIVPRSDSLPSCFSKISVNELTSMIYRFRATPTDVNNRPASSAEENCCLELNASNLVAVTPPPSYRSLITHNLADVPPSYESVTGLSLHIGQVGYQ